MDNLKIYIIHYKGYKDRKIHIDRMLKNIKKLITSDGYTITPFTE